MPSLVAFDAKTFMLSFRLAPRETKGYAHLHSLSKAALILSHDKGKTWSAPSFPCEDDEAAKQDPQLTLLPNGTVMLTYFRYLFHSPSEEAVLARERGLIVMHENRKKVLASLRGVGYALKTKQGFSSAARLTLPGVRSAALRGSAAVVGKRVLFPLYAIPNGTRYAIHLVAYDVEHDAWQQGTRICQTKIRSGTRVEYVEPSLVRTNDGRLHAFIRTHEIKTRGSVDGYISYCYSDDGGASFTRLRKTNIDGYPLTPLCLQNGRVLLVYGFRRGKQKGVRFRVCDESLRDMERAEEHVLDGASVSADCGYPWAAEAAAGDVLVAYYMSTKAGAEIRTRSIPRALINGATKP